MLFGFCTKSTISTASDPVTSWFLGFISCSCVPEGTPGLYPKVRYIERESTLFQVPEGTLALNPFHWLMSERSCARKYAFWFDEKQARNALTLSGVPIPSMTSRKT